MAVGNTRGMELGISGKVAMVAASSKGIGLATAQALAAEGCRLSICARTEGQLEEAAALVGEETRSYVVDVSSAEDLAWYLFHDDGGIHMPFMMSSPSTLGAARNVSA